MGRSIVSMTDPEPTKFILQITLLLVIATIVTPIENNETSTVPIYLFQEKDPQVQRVDVSWDGVVTGVSQETNMVWPDQMFTGYLMVATKNQILTMSPTMSPDSRSSQRIMLYENGSSSSWQDITYRLNSVTFAAADRSAQYGDSSDSQAGYIPHHEVVFVCGCWGKCNLIYPCRFVNVTNPNMLGWVHGASGKYVENDEAANHYMQGAAVHQAKIYLTGGWSSLTTKISRRLFVFDYQKAKWQAEAPEMPAAIARHASAVINNKLVVCGGIELRDHKNMPINRCCSFNIATNKWDNCTFSPLCIPLSDHYMFTIGHTLIVVGGITTGDVSNTRILVYNASEEKATWHCLTTPTIDSSMKPFGKLYAVMPYKEQLIINTGRNIHQTSIVVFVSSIICLLLIPL